MLIFTLLIFASCSNNELDKLRKENQNLRTQIEKQRVKLKSIKNAFIIPYDSIGQYMMPVTYGEPELKVHEKSEFSTMLTWSKFPKGINYEWQITKGAGDLKNKDSKELLKHVKYSYSESGEKEMMWMKPAVIKHD